MGKNGTGTATRTGEGDYACLRCPLPDCDEADPRCLLQRGREPFKRSKWSRVYEQIAALAPDEEDAVIVKRAEVRALQRCISDRHREGRLPKVRTRREDAWGDSCRLFFRVVGNEGDGET